MNSKMIFLLLFLLIQIAFAQTEKFVPDSSSMANMWRLSNNTELFVGASFYYMDPSDSIVVWLDTSESDRIGDLYMMIPGYRDSAMLLFSNADTGSRINVTRQLTNPIIPGTEIFFMYKRRDAVYPKFTGQNRMGIDPSDKSAFPGADFVAREFDRRPGFGHRWAVAGRVVNNSNIATDTVIFGFEDMVNFIDPNDTLVISDRDFNDVIFRVTGLQLNVEKFPDSLELILPDSVIAGDTIISIAKVWFDSSGQKIINHSLDSLIKWNLNGFSKNHDTLIQGLTQDTVRFLPRTAFKEFNICISLLDPVSGNLIKTCKNIRVLPGKPDHLSIELRADTASSDFSLNQNVQISRVLIPSNKLAQNIYAIFRDKFGNFSSFSPSTVWDTSSNPLISGLSPGCLSISNGNLSIGEGIIQKINSGNLLVTARDIYSTDTLRDTVLVNISAASYDSLRIVKFINGNFYPISSLIISTDTCEKDLWSQGRRIDNGKWEILKTVWNSQKWNLNLNNVAYSDIEFCPADTGKGFLEIQYEGYLTTKISVQAVPGAPDRVDLYTDAGTVFPVDTTVLAGNPMNIYLCVFDKHNILLKNVKVDSIFWTLQDDTTGSISDPSAVLNKQYGENVLLNPIKAYRTIKIRANYRLFSDSAKIAILPGKPARIVIESHADWHRSLFSPDEADTVEIPDNATTETVYAIIRDSLGNYIDSLREGSWNTADTVVKIQAGTHPCIGIITKNLQIVSGLTTITVTNGSLSDTAYVKLLPYHFIQVRITNDLYVPINSLTMSTNQDTVLNVQGLRSDTALWREIPVNWYKTDALIIDPQCPSKSSSYSFSPVKPGNGILYVKYPVKDTLRDTISVIFTRGEPVRAEFHLLTPTDKLVAGDTISALITILNKDGLVPGEYCFGSSLPTGQIYYADSLGYGGSAYVPTISSDVHKAIINKPSSRSSGLNQCFSEGRDTVKMILYYAPFNRDSLHQILLQFGKIYAHSNPFRIKPASLNSLSLAHTHKCCSDSLVLRYPDDQALIYAIGYDKYGNMRGGEPSKWRTTGTLHSCDTQNVTTRVIYGADSSVVSDDESGKLIAVSQQNKFISDTLRVVVIGPLSKPVSAITRDINGNGLLDRIEIKFDMPVYKNSKQIASYFSIGYNKNFFRVDSLTISKDSTNLTLFLYEPSNEKNLQTNWMPLISFHNLNFALGGAVDSFEIEPKDGAGPVIKSVIKEIRNDNRTNDLVTVTFSEDVTGPQGSQFSYLKMPEEVFRVFTNSSTGNLTQIQFLSGIKNFNAPVYPQFATFNTSNGKDLTERYFFDIRTDNKAYAIQDLSGNKPSPFNRKVQVQVHGTVQTELLVAPNPSRPSTVHERPGEFHLIHNPRAIDWVIKEKAGVAIVFQIQLNDAKTPVIGGQMVILDMMGNTVIADPETDYKLLNLFNNEPVVSNQKHLNIIPSSWDANGAIHEFVIYWNGYTKNGKKAAPGVYRAILKLFTKSGNKDKVTTYVGKIGLKP